MFKTWTSLVKMCGQCGILLGVVCGLSGMARASDSDSAANYSQSAGNWVSGTHRGTFNFGDWVFDGSASANSGWFIGDSTLGGADINSDGKSFAIYGHTGTYQGAARYFAKRTWTTGDTLTFRIAVNFRNGAKGFTLRNEDDTSVWRFLTGRINDISGNYVNEQNVGLNAYHENTIFTFTFTQRARDLVWTMERSGGLTGSASGTNAIPSGTVRYLRFYIDSTDNSLAANNLYFNDFQWTPAVRNDAPLTLGERRYPGYEPSYMLRFEDPVASSVTFRSSHDNWTTSYPLTNVGSNVWEMDIRDAGLTPGWHTFKFRPNSEYESGANRRMFIRSDGKIVKPPAVWLTWMQDPTTTMTVRWMATAADTGIRYRALGDPDWEQTNAVAVTTFPFSDRWIQHIELTGLAPNTVYEFEIDGYLETYSFKTMPATLDEPLNVMFTGDILFGEVADAMMITAGALDPAFLAIGGDLAYSDGRADQIWMEYFYFENWHTRFRAPDGRLIPLIPAIGNHEMRKAYVMGYPYYEDTDAWREREAPYYFRPYAFPGQPGYGVLDFGDYMSLVLLDTDHANPMLGAQTDWLTDRLDERRHVRHLFPIYHVPAYPSHRSLGDARNVNIRANWLPIFEEAGIHMAFEHHDHTFKRTPPLLEDGIHADGIVFLGDGACGVATRDVKDPESRHYLQVAQKRHHVYLVTLTDTGRLARAVDVDGVFFDHVSQIGDGIPDAPTGLVLDQATAHSAALSWPSVPRAISYRIERDGVFLADTTDPHYVDNDRTPETAADYQIFAENRSGRSGGSSIIEGITTPLPPLPGVPSQLAATAIGPTSIQLAWAPAAHAYTYTVRRDGDEVATEVQGASFADSGLDADTLYAYTVRADNVTGSSAYSAEVEATTGSPIVPFTLDGQPESPGYLLASPGMTLYAAVRGTELYVATWSPAFDASDHFIFISDRLLPRATSHAPWGKKGFTAHPSGAPFLAAESSADYIEWNNAPIGSGAFRSELGDGKIEGRIDLVETFGHVPNMLYLASASYGTAEFNSLNSQAPTGDGNENIDPEEFLAVPVDAVRDSLGIGVYDRLDPEREFVVGAAPLAPGQPFAVRWNAVPGRAYHIWRSTNLAGNVWTRITVDPVTAPSGSDVMTFHDASSATLAHACYTVEYAND